MSKLLEPMQQEQGWKPLTTPEMQQWDKPGIQIAGKLLSIVSITIKGNAKPVLQYLLATGKDARLKFLATYDLAQKLTREHIGMLVRIKYLGEDETVKKGVNFMKVFDVHVRPDPDAAAHPDGRPISDEDIPF
jgi:hypothetical protein